MTQLRLSVTSQALLDIRTPHSLVLSPCDDVLVFAVTEPDWDESRWVSRLWAIDLPDGRARQLTFSFEGERDPQWSPDGRYVAFLSTRPDMTTPLPEPDEDEDDPREQVWLLPMAGGEAFRLTNHRGGVIRCRWMPDSRSVLVLTPEWPTSAGAFVIDDQRKRKCRPSVESEQRPRWEFWETGVDDRKPELVYTADPGVQDFDVSPDGRCVAYTTNRSGDPNDYHVCDLVEIELESQTEPELLLGSPGLKLNPRYVPDGRGLCYIGPRDPRISCSQECLWLLAPDSDEPTNLFGDVAYDCDLVHWANDGAGVVCVVADRAVTRLVRLGADAWVDVTGATGGYEVLDAAIGRDGAIYAAIETNDSAPEVYRVGGAQRDAVTELNRGFAEAYVLPRQRTIRWTTDAGEVEGVLTEPDGAMPVGGWPLVVQIHGGPHARSVDTLHGYYHHMAFAARGYLVLQPNFRGSAGYGHQYSTCIRGDLAAGPYRDIAGGVDTLVSAGLADPSRMGIMGGSYGGYMVNWTIGQTDRFRAAVSMFGVFSLLSDYGSSEIARWEHDYLGVWYWEDMESYWRMSPASQAGRIRTPVLLIHGDGDLNTFPSNSREMHRALKDLGVSVEYVRYPREGHGISEPHNKLDEIRRCIGWFDRHLLPDARDQEYAVGDRVAHDGHELVVVRAADVDCAGWPEGGDRLIEVVFTLTSRDPVESGWTMYLADARLGNPDGEQVPPVGIPADCGGGKHLVQGDSLCVHVDPDRDTGRLSLAMAVCFAIPFAGGRFRFTVGDMPSVLVDLGRTDQEEGPRPGNDAEQEDQE